MWVDHDQWWLVKGSYQIFPRLVVDPGLSADRAVDHRQQTGGNLNQADASEHRRRDKARKVSDDPAAKRDNDIATLDSSAEEPILKCTSLSPALAGLSGGHGHGRAGESGTSEGTRDAVAMELF